MEKDGEAEPGSVSQTSGFLAAWREAAANTPAGEEIVVPSQSVNPMNNVAVFASSHRGSHKGGGEAFQEEAGLLGRQLADDGRMLIHWGAAKGLMKLVSRSWQETAGFCSVNPGNKPDTNHLDVITEKQQVFARSQAALALPGGISVIDKLTDAIVYNYLEGYKPRGEQRPIPLILINKNNGFSGFKTLIRHMVNNGFCRSGAFGLFEIAQDTQHSLQILRGLETSEIDRIKPVANVDSQLTDGGVIHDLGNVDHGAEGQETLARLKREEQAADRSRRVSVFVGSSLGNNPIYAEDARKFSALIQEAGYSLIYGGGRQGSMGQVLEGFSEGLSDHEISERVIPVSMSVFAEHEDYPSKKREILCDDIYTRKKIMTHHTDAMIALPGGLGTLDEILDGIRYNYVCLVAGEPEKMKPLILLNREEFWSPLTAWFWDKTIAKLVEPEIMETFMLADTPEDAIKKIQQFDPLAKTVPLPRGLTLSNGSTFER